MLVLPVVVLGKSLLLVALAFVLVHLIIGLSVSLVFQTTHTVDSTYFPSDRGEFDNGVYHIFATTADYATENPLVAWLAGGLNHHIVHHLCPFVCHTHYAPLTRIVKTDRRGVSGSLSATSHHDAGNRASSDAFEATGKRRLSQDARPGSPNLDHHRLRQTP